MSEYITEWVDNLPDMAHGEEIVRCRDCLDCIYGWCLKLHDVVAPDRFCAWGKTQGGGRMSTLHYLEYDPETGEGHEIDPFKRPDLVAVVRCRDCTGMVETWDGYECERFSGEYHRAEPDGFCAWAIRKEVRNG